jgi:hypothetical protein
MWHALARVVQALVDPEKSRDLRKCYEQYADDLDKLRCVLSVAGAEDVWNRYAGLWSTIKEMRNEFDRCIEKGLDLPSRVLCIERIIADNIELEAVNGTVKFVRRHRGGE